MSIVFWNKLEITSGDNLHSSYFHADVIEYEVAHNDMKLGCSIHMYSFIYLSKISYFLRIFQIKSAQQNFD